MKWKNYLIRSQQTKYFLFLNVLPQIKEDLKNEKYETILLCLKIQNT